MTVQAGPTEKRYAANGVTTVYAVPFLVIEAGDLKAYLNGVLQTSGYTQTGVGQPTSSITFAIPPTGDLYLVLEVPFQRLVDYQENGDFLSSTVNRDFDRIWQALKQLFRGVTRALVLGETDVDGSGAYRAKGNRIADLGDPIAPQDAATKNWVGSFIDSVSGLINTTTGIAYDGGTLFDYLRFGVNRAVDSIAALRTLSSARNQRAFVHGYYSRGDGGGGAYFMDATDTVSADNGGTIIVSADGGRWKLSQVGSISAKQFGAKGDGINNDSIPINAAVATGRLIYCPAGSYRFLGTVTLVQGGGLQGDGEKTQFVRGFTGGQMIRHPGGNQLGSPIILRDFCITKEVAIVVANGDTGIDIGYSTAWGGRGDISNIMIIFQWDGFKWKGGSMNPITNVQVHEGKGNGFLGIDARGELVSCLAQYNAGHGYFFFAQTQNETGVQLTSCGTFANQGWGYLFDAAPGVIGANIYMKGVSSSTDGTGGIGFVKEYRQIWWTQLLIESAGDAYVPFPSFVVHNDAKGLFVVGGCKNIVGSDIYIQTCRSGGAYFDSVSRATLTNMIVLDNGRGGLGGEHAVGVNFNAANTDFVINGLVANFGATQTVDVGSSNVSNQVDLSGANFRTFSPTGTSVRFTTDVRSTASTTVASAGTVTLPAFYDYVDISGTTTITAIAASYRGRKVTLRFLGALTVTDAGVLQLTGNLVTTVGTTLTLICDGSNWSEVSRSIV